MRQDKRLGRVLVVDDDPLVADMIATGLMRRGYEAIVSHSPLQAIRSFQKNGPWWAIITDQIMPDMSGATLIRLIKQEAPELPCVLCTGFEGYFDTDEVKTCGADARFVKPIDFDQLFAILARFAPCS